VLFVGYTHEIIRGSAGQLLYDSGKSSSLDCIIFTALLEVCHYFK